MDGLAQKTSKLRAPAEFKGTQQSLVSWLHALSEMVGREHTSLSALKERSTVADLN